MRGGKTLCKKKSQPIQWMFCAYKTAKSVLAYKCHDGHHPRQTFRENLQGAETVPECDVMALSEMYLDGISAPKMFIPRWERKKKQNLPRAQKACRRLFH